MATKKVARKLRAKCCIYSLGRLDYSGLRRHCLFHARTTPCGRYEYRRFLRSLGFSPGAQKHLFHISSTKGLRPGIYASMVGNPKKAIFLSSAILHSNQGGSKYPLNVTLNSQFEYIFQTCLKMFSIGVEVRIPNS